MLDKYLVILAVGAFIVDHSGKVLIVKKSLAEKIDGGLWTIPGGKVDPPETILDGLMREVKEEVSLEITIDRWLGEDVFSSAGHFYHAQHFMCHKVGGIVKLEPKLLEYRWIGKNEVNNFKFPTNIKNRILEILI